MVASYHHGEPGSQSQKARYQITKNVFVSCFLDIIEANNQEVRAFLGIKHRSDGHVPIGTRIFLSQAEGSASGNEFSSFSVTVLKIDSQGDRQIHICTPIHKQTQANRRALTRKPVGFPVLLVDSQTVFFAVNGSAAGLELSCIAQKAILKLTVNQVYQFKVNCKGEDCLLQGVVKHIQYDWRTFQHRVGVHFPALGKDEQIILNWLVDPDYKVPISQNQTIDTATGKISLNE